MCNGAVSRPGIVCGVVYSVDGSLLNDVQVLLREHAARGAEIERLRSELTQADDELNEATNQIEDSQD